MTSAGFTLSLLTAVLLKIALEVVIVLKTKVIDRFRTAKTRRAKVTANGSLWVVAAGSKLVVLELVDLAFGDTVSLGGFIPVTALVVALLVSRAAVRRCWMTHQQRPDQVSALRVDEGPRRPGDQGLASCQQVTR